LQNRLLRLAPPYFAALLLSVGIHAALWHVGTLILWDYPQAGAPVTLARVGAGLLGLVPGVQGRFGDNFEFIPFAWSLRMEMAFYVAVTLGVWAGRGGVIAALVAALIGSAVFLLQGRPGLLSCAPMFLLGTALCLALRAGGMGRWLYLAAVVPVAGWGFASWGQHGHPVLPVQFLLLALLLAAFAVLAASEGSRRWRALDRRLGDLSYPLYLNHYGVAIACASSGFSPSLTLYATGALAALVLAVLMAGLVDSRFATLRDRIRAAPALLPLAGPARAKRAGWGEPAIPPSPG
jgi:peptidoglycan/LPS O-acetylase OafA/YrhL